MTDLDKLTHDLGVAYNAWKTNEQRKNELKDNFFEALTGQISKDTAATQIIHIDGATSMENAKEIALRRNPGWKSIGVHLEALEDGDFYYVTLEEDLEFKPAAYINRADRMVYQRTVVEGPVLLDDEGLKAERPDLWKTITREKVIEEIIPFEELHASTLEAIAKYLYKGPPQVRFLAPRPARDDELVGE